MSDSEEYKKCLAEIRKMFEKFCNGMSEEEKDKTLQKFVMAQGGPEATTANKYFKEGSKLGLTIAALVPCITFCICNSAKQVL